MMFVISFITKLMIDNNIDKEVTAMTNYLSASSVNS